MKKNMDYMQAYKELEKMVEQLSDGDIPLEDLTQKVEQANALLAICEKKLKGVKDDLVKISDEEE